MPTKSQVQSEVEEKLVASERLDALVEYVSFQFLFVPHIAPTGNYATVWSGALALTSRRVIAVWVESRHCWKWLYIPALNSVSERFLRSDKPSWPYQAILMIPGGIGLVVQTDHPEEERGRPPDVERGRRLSSLVNEAIVRFGGSREDTGSIAAILAHEEAEERRRQEQEEESRRRAQEEDRHKND